MDKQIILMCKDKEVAKMNKDGWDISLPNLLPKNLRVTSPKESETLIGPTFSSDFIGWCASRVLAIDRVYAKKILNSLSLSQGQTPDEKAQIALSFRCVSLCDSYWIKFNDSDDVKWKDISLRHNSLNRSVALIALTGRSMTISMKSLEFEPTAEISTLGSYAKGWFREDVPYLYKADGFERDEVKREVCASKVIDCFNVYGNVKYEYATLDGVTYAKCRVMTTDDKAIVHASDMQIWCLQNNTDVITYARKHFEQQFAQMCVIDYLVANSDRHGWNWGFFQDMNTGDIAGLHDLYDHNNCFDRDAMEHDNFKSLVQDGKSLKEAALFYVKRSGLKLITTPRSRDFPSRFAFNTFNKRIRELGLVDSEPGIFTSIKHLLKT